MFQKVVGKIVYKNQNPSIRKEPFSAHADYIGGIFIFVIGLTGRDQSNYAGSKKT